MKNRIHFLKLNIEFCDDVLNGEKSFEIRYNDRNYQKGDRIKFVPVDKNGNTDKVTHNIKNREYVITYVLNGWGLKNEYVALAIKEISFLEAYI